MQNLEWLRAVEFRVWIQVCALLVVGTSFALGQTYTGKLYESVPVLPTVPMSVLASKANHQSRRCLGGQTAQHQHGHKQRRGHWSQRQRHQAFEWISSQAKARLANQTKGDQRHVNAAWRHAVEAWLGDQALIAVSIKTKSVTPF